MKKKIIYLFLLLFIFQFTGCETMQRKFTPKKKTPAHVATSIFFEEGAYQKKYSNEYYYKTHYTMSRTWHDDLLDNLGGNDKKVERCAQESIGNLQQMQQYLKPEKFDQLQIIINDLAAVIKKLGDSGGASQVGPIRTELERIRRAVGNDFYFDKVKDSLLADHVDLGGQNTDSSAPAPDAKVSDSKVPDSKTPAAA